MLLWPRSVWDGVADTRKIYTTILFSCSRPRVCEGLVLLVLAKKMDSVHVSCISSDRRRHIVQMIR